AGSKSAEIFFAIKADKVFEPNETFQIVWSESSVPVKTATTVNVTITNDDSSPVPAGASSAKVS
ncbi:MAG TPA: hypothetical protein VGB45_14115, partial [Abditibacterium sp.]